MFDNRNTPKSKSDEPVTLAEACRLTPGTPSCAAMWRWTRKGLIAKNGDRVRLEHMRVGRRIFVRPSAILDFCERLAEADAQGLAPSEEPRSRKRRDTHRHAAIEQARAEVALELESK